MLKSLVSTRLRFIALLVLVMAFTILTGLVNAQYAGKEFRGWFWNMKKLATAEVPTVAQIASAPGYSAFYLDSTGVPKIKNSAGTVVTLATYAFPALTADTFIYAGTAGAITSQTAATNGQLQIGSTGTFPAKATLTAGTGMTITNGAGSITLTPNFAAPPTIGTTPGLISGTTITATTAFAGPINGTVGAVTPAAGTFTTSTSTTSSATPLFKQTGANGQIANIQSATAVVSAFTGASMTATAIIPAGSIVLGVTIRVTTAITSGDGSVAMTIGDGTDVDRWGTGIVFTLGTTTTNADTTITSIPVYAAATNVVFTATGGTFSGGAVRVTVHYISLTAATS